MKFIYFTDIHLCEGIDSQIGFERCIESMLSHEPQVLVNGGDLGVTPEALALYDELTRNLPMPILLGNGNHEMCSGYLPRAMAGTGHQSTDVDGVHFVLLDVVRYFEPTEEHPANWHVLADKSLLDWLSDDLSRVSKETPLIVASHVALSTTFPFRHGQVPGMAFPTNEVKNASGILALLEPYAHVATLHGHDHENCRHFYGNIEIMTTAAVAGNWWRNGLESRCLHGREPQGYRLIEIGPHGDITSHYYAYTLEQDEQAEYFLRVETGRRFINVFDGSPKTRVEADDLGPLKLIDPLAESSIGLGAHIYELPSDFDRVSVDISVTWEDNRKDDLTLKLVEAADPGKSE